MDPTGSEFYPNNVDRTAYTACVWVGLIVGAVFIAGFVALWQLGGWVHRQQVSLHLSVPAISPLPSSGVLNSIEQKASNAAQQQIDQQKAQVKQDVQSQVEQQLKKQLQ